MWCFQKSLSCVCVQTHELADHHSSNLKGSEEPFVLVPSVRLDLPLSEAWGWVGTRNLIHKQKEERRGEEWEWAMNEGVEVWLSLLTRLWNSSSAREFRRNLGQTRVTKSLYGRGSPFQKYQGEAKRSSYRVQLQLVQLPKWFSPPVQNVAGNYYKHDSYKSNRLCFVSDESLHRGSHNFLLIHLFQAYDLPGPKIHSELPNINPVNISIPFKA